jgi:hypothetical protein
MFSSSACPPTHSSIFTDEATKEPFDNMITWVKLPHYTVSCAKPSTSTMTSQWSGLLHNPGLKIICTTSAGQRGYHSHIQHTMPTTSVRNSCNVFLVDSHAPPFRTNLPLQWLHCLLVPLLICLLSLYVSVLTAFTHIPSSCTSSPPPPPKFFSAVCQFPYNPSICIVSFCFHCISF